MSDAAPAADAVRAAALRLLARREHTQRELQEKLTRRGHDLEEVEAALAALAEEGVLDEARFAEAFVHSRTQRGQGPVRIAQEMHQRGVPRTLADEALAAADVDWRDQARAVRRQRYGEAVPADRHEAARQMQFLQRRGFTAEQARAAAAAADEDE